MKRKSVYIAARDIRDKERVVSREAEKLRRITLDLTLEEDFELEDSFDMLTPKNGQNYFSSPPMCKMSPPTLSVKHCLRSTKLLTKHYSVTFFNDPHADSIVAPVAKNVASRSVVANFHHTPSRFNETKPIPSSEHIFVIYMSASYDQHFTQLSVDVRNNRLTRRQDRKTIPRWPLTYDAATEKHTLAHHNTKTLSERLKEVHRVITLAAEEATFRAIAPSERLHVIFPGDVLDTGATKHAGADATAILAHLDNFFLMHPEWFLWSDRQSLCLITYSVQAQCHTIERNAIFLYLVLGYLMLL